MSQIFRLDLKIEFCGCDVLYKNAKRSLSFRLQSQPAARAQKQKRANLLHIEMLMQLWQHVLLLHLFSRITAFPANSSSASTDSGIIDDLTMRPPQYDCLESRHSIHKLATVACSTAIRHLPNGRDHVAFHSGAPQNLGSLPVTASSGLCKIVVDFQSNVWPSPRPWPGPLSFDTWDNLRYHAERLNTACVRSPEYGYGGVVCVGDGRRGGVVSLRLDSIFLSEDQGAG